MEQPWCGWIKKLSRAHGLAFIQQTSESLLCTQFPGSHQGWGRGSVLVLLCYYSTQSEFLRVENQASHSRLGRKHAQSRGSGWGDPGKAQPLCIPVNVWASS